MWHGLDRPLDAATCDLLIGRVLAGVEGEQAAQALDAAAESFRSLGVAHMAERAQGLSAPQV
jgi:hypothetical protein